jgi:hypothetical protein
MLTVFRSFQPHPSLMARNVSLETVRALRLNQGLSASLQEVRETEALLWNHQGALGAAQSSTPQSTSALALSSQWASMVSSARMMHQTSQSRQQLMFAPPRFVTPSTHWQGRGAFVTPPVNQYLHHQQTFHRECARQYESVNRGTSAFTSPLHSIPQVLILSNVTCALPAVLSRTTDEVVLSKFQIFLRIRIERLLQGMKMCLVGFVDGTSQCSCTKLVSAVAIVRTYQSIGASREPSTFPRPPWDSTKRLKTCAPHICNVDYVPKCQSRSRRSLRN